MAELDGLALGAAAAGSLFIYAGIKGYSVPHALQSLIKGQAPGTGQAAQPLTAPQGAGSPVSLSSLGSGSGSAIAADALRYEGTPYTWDGAPGTQPMVNGIGPHDCSSLANWVYGHDMGLAIPGYGIGTYDGSSHGPPTGLWLIWTGCTTVGHDGNQAQAGDLAVWQTHMGICLGPDQMLSAQTEATGTQISAINGFIPEILFIRRMKAVEGITSLHVAPSSQLPGGVAG